MRNVNYSLVGFSCAAILMISALAPLPAHAVKVFNVKSYGAIGNGATDDTAAIDNAAAAAVADPGSTLLFPKGNYLIHGLLTVQGIEVVGQNATLTTTSTGGLEVTGERTRVHDMRFASTLSANAGTAGILVDRATNFEIRNNSFAAFTDCISVSQSSNGKINENNMQLSSASISGVRLSASSNITAHSNVIGGGGGNTAGAFRPSNCNKITIDINKMTNLAFGIFSQQNTDDSYTNNYLEQFANNGIDLNTDTRVTVAGSRIILANNAAIRVAGVSTANIRSNFMGGGQIGINLVNGSAVDIRGNEITGVFNAISGGLVAGLNIVGNNLEGLTSVINQFSDVNLVIKDNEIARCNNAGIYVKNCIIATEIKNNSLQRCALAPSNPKAIIYVDCPIGSSIQIESNTYSGATKATYFIWCVQPSPPSVVKNNRTNTTLPNRIGS